MMRDREGHLSHFNSDNPSLARHKPLRLPLPWMTQAIGGAHDTAGAVPMTRTPPALSPDDHAMIFAAAAPLLCHPLAGGKPAGQRGRNTLEATIYHTGRFLVVNRTCPNEAAIPTHKTCSRQHAMAKDRALPNRRRKSPTMEYCRALTHRRALVPSVPFLRPRRELPGPGTVNFSTRNWKSHAFASSNSFPRGKP